MAKIKLVCEWCGKEIFRYPSKVKPHNFCSKECLGKFSSKTDNPSGYAYRNFSKNSERFTAMNLAVNKDRMTASVRQKLSSSRYGRGNKTPYRKRHGRHEHRSAAAGVIGRPLLPGEVVHHTDGNRYNNAPENLMVFSSQSEHAAYHAAQKRGDRLEKVRTV